MQIYKEWGAVANLLFPQIPVFCIQYYFYNHSYLLHYKISVSEIIKDFKMALSYFIFYISLCLFWFIQTGMKFLKNTFIPTIHFNKDFIGILVAILGTTISPYLFFWQTTMEAEGMNHRERKIFVNKKYFKRHEEGCKLRHVVFKSGNVFF